jgi:GNAT superfamily N-acetyltransferase
MGVLRFPEPDVPPELRLQVRRLQEQAWPGEEPVVLGPVHDPALAPLSLLLVEDGRVLAALDVLSKRIRHAGATFAARGLSTVVTDVELRGRGFGRALVEAAREEIEASGADLGIFTCDRLLRAFYERAGWELLPGAVLVGGTPEEPLPSDGFDKVVLARFFSARARQHAAAFADARIELYPGEVDRLW